MPSGNVKAFAHFVSTQLNLERWSFTAEYERISLERRGLFPESAPRFLRDNTHDFFT